MLDACRSRVDRVTIDILTDALVDVSVEVCYKIHDPNKELNRNHIRVNVFHSEGQLDPTIRNKSIISIL